MYIYTEYSVFFPKKNNKNERNKNSTVTFQHVHNSSSLSTHIQLEIFSMFSSSLIFVCPSSCPVQEKNNSKNSQKQLKMCRLAHFCTAGREKDLYKEAHQWNYLHRWIITHAHDWKEKIKRKSKKNRLNINFIYLYGGKEPKRPIPSSHRCTHSNHKPSVFTISK